MEPVHVRRGDSWRLQLPFVETHGIANRAARSADPRTTVGEAAKSRIGYELDPIADPRWTALVDRHPRGSVFHSTSWLRALREVYGYEPAVVTTSAPGELLTNGLVFCRVKSWLTGNRLVSLPFSDYCEPLTEGQNDLDVILGMLRGAVEGGRWKYVEIRPDDREPGSPTGLSRFETYHLHSLDLHLAEDQIFRKFHKDCIQRKIRRAERESLQYEEGTSETLLKKFYRLVVMTRRRQLLPPQPLNWFRSLLACFGTDVKIRVASKDGLPVASILTLSHRKSMVYKYGCSNAAFNNLGGTPFLFWKAIQEAKTQGFERFEMGRSAIDNPGLVAFKEHLGASGKLISYWIYPEGRSGPTGAWKDRLARRILPVIPDLALEISGRLLYRHIG
jgi:CelD/BcsL family acetyltransferase involved in cellulose biosynthesis